MDYKKLGADTWKSLDKNGNLNSGYKSIWLGLQDQEESLLHIFKDSAGYSHCAIEAVGVLHTDIVDPCVNGLTIELASYKFKNGPVSSFIDLTCSLSTYIEEFTEVVREICYAVLEEHQTPVEAVNQVISNWLSFWSAQRNSLLGEEEQTGLICELLTLEQLCQINPGRALQAWTGPLGEKHDFNFSDWNLEVKGTRKANRNHTINGIDQLKPAYNKQLAFLSYQLHNSNHDAALNLPSLINTIIERYFEKKPQLVTAFHDLLFNAGYSPVYAEEYRKFKVELITAELFEIDMDFPRLTSSMLQEPLNQRVTQVRYDIGLNGLSGINFNEINWGNYFY